MASPFRPARRCSAETGCHRGGGERMTRDSESLDPIERKLGDLGRNALDELCKKGCDRQELLGLFGWLTAYKPIQIGNKAVDLRELDSRTSAHPGYSLARLTKVAGRARRLQAEISDLRRTPLVHALVDRG